MDEQRWVKANVSRLTGELQGAASLAEFGQRLLSDLVPMLGGGAAGFYVLDEGHAELRRVATYGMADVSDIPSGHPARRGPRGSMRAGTANARAGESPAGLPAHFLRSRPGGAGAGDGHAGDIQRYAARRARSRILPAAHREGAGAARRIAARRRHEPGGPAAQPSDRGAARADPGAGASTRDPGGGAGRRQAQGRRSHRNEVDVPREHEPRDPHADERHHRPVASGAQDVALAEAARLREQDPQRGHVAARRDQRHPRLFEDRGRPARYRDARTSGWTR